MNLPLLRGARKTSLQNGLKHCSTEEQKPFQYASFAWRNLIIVGGGVSGNFTCVISTNKGSNVHYADDLSTKGTFPTYFV